MDEIVRMLRDLADGLRQFLEAALSAVRDWLNQGPDELLERVKELWDNREQLPNWLRERLAGER